MTEPRIHADVDPLGAARETHERGDQMYQCAVLLMVQDAVIVAMVGSTNNAQFIDQNQLLNDIGAAGWELITMSVTFVNEGEQSRDKFMSSGQNVAIKGRLLGYYIFRRVDHATAAPPPPPPPGA